MIRISHPQRHHRDGDRTYILRTGHHRQPRNRAHRPRASELQFTNLLVVGGSSATVTPIRPMFLPKCVWLRLAPSIVLCGRPTALASASVEEIGSFAGQPAPRPESKKLPQPANGNGNYGGRTVRDRLCQLIRQHQLDATLVKSYATDFCGVKSLREATREQVENFVAHLSDWAEKDRNALLCQLNSYLGQKAGAA